MSGKLLSFDFSYGRNYSNATFHDVKDTDQHRKGRPYKIFKHPGRSKVVIYFNLSGPERSALKNVHFFLNHCGTTSNGVIDVLVNGTAAYTNHRAPRDNFDWEEMALEAGLFRAGDNQVVIRLGQTSPGPFWLSECTLFFEQHGAVVNTRASLLADPPQAPSRLEDIQPELLVFHGSPGAKPIKAFQWYDSCQSFSDEIKKCIKGKELQYRIIFITHGFVNDDKAPWLHNLKDELLKREDCNKVVVLVGWGKGASWTNMPPYLGAIENLTVVAKWLATYLQIVRRTFPSTYMYGIGHSLGAHLMGQTGRMSGAFDRITGLDPAGPDFERTNIDKRLCRSDARKMVDVIHTDGYYNGFYLFVRHFGTLIPLGTADFYPNYGISLQPGVSRFAIGASHQRAYEYFIWSVSNPGAFRTNLSLDGVPDFEKPVMKTKSVDCWVEMGYYADREAIPENNFYYIKTNDMPPWK